MAGRPEQTPILSPVESLRASPTGGFVELDGEAYYKSYPKEMKYQV